jgi:putative tributyrin esterase
VSAVGTGLFTAALVLGAAAPLVAQERGTVEADWMQSRLLGARKSYRVYLPPSYETSGARRYPVAYYLHGVQGNETDWVERGRLASVMDSLVAAGMPEMIVVMPDGDDGFYTSWARPPQWRLCPQRTDLREPATEFCVRHPRYDQYVAQELVLHIDATFRTLPDARHRGIAGLSMGGFGALALATQYPLAFSAAASHSGAVTALALAVDTAAGAVTWAATLDTVRARRPSLFPLLAEVFGADTSDWWERDPVGRVRRIGAEDRRGLPALYADVGTGDSFLLNNRALRIELARLGVPLEYHEYPGAHDWTYWRGHVAQSLTWLAERIAR